MFRGFMISSASLFFFIPVSEMLPGQDTDRDEIQAPEQQSNTPAVTAFSVCHGGKHTSHGHNEAAGKEDPVDDQQAFEPVIRFVSAFMDRPMKNVESAIMPYPRRS